MEEPTPRRLERAREEGDSGASTFAAQAVAFAALVALVPSAGRAAATHLAGEVRGAIEAGRGPEVTARALSFDAAKVVWDVLALVGPLVLAAGAVFAAAELVQTGGAFASKQLGPRLDRLDPARGLRALVSFVRLFTVLRAFAFAAVVVAILAHVLASHAVDFARLAGRLPLAAGAASAIASETARDAALAGLLLAVVDVAVVRGAWRRRLRMTPAEVLRERKESEGDPRVKEARARAHRLALDAGTLDDVAAATVVVAFGSAAAAALRYEPADGDAAPVVLARGEGDHAAHLLGVARRAGVPVVDDGPLARSLVDLEVGGPIPERLYDAVAAVLPAR